SRVPDPPHMITAQNLFASRIFGVSHSKSPVLVHHNQDVLAAKPPLYGNRTFIRRAIDQAMVIFRVKQAP
ncbi:MAG TPA: hypothetical protein VET25_13355, partial [Aestuariivirgaceae bacterium]|nr:hypothetical protein [Aestuariivirgaceae bacterium]